MHFVNPEKYILLVTIIQKPQVKPLRYFSYISACAVPFSQYRYAVTCQKEISPLLKSTHFHACWSAQEIQVGWCDGAG